MQKLYKATVVISPVDTDWFYKINKYGLCVNNRNLNAIIADPDVPKDVKKQIQNIF